ALEAIYASQLVKQGLKSEEIIKKIQERIPYNQTSFVLATVDYLYKGGRCSGLAKLGAQLFRIRPQIIMADGKMSPGKKYIGKQIQCVDNYVRDTLEQFNNPDLSLVFITHSQATPEMVEVAKKQLEARGFKRIIETTAGATISSHCGPKCLGILFLNDGGK
ncbi:MAG: DegV family protein, partial [Bacilli bacterium]|nr:DegV family protein [Bacilli bacterium]